MKNVENNCSPLGKLTPSATLEITAKAKDMKEKGLDVCSMTAGELDFDTPQIIKEACFKALDEGKVKYLPSSGLLLLKDAIVRKFQKNGIMTNTSNITICPGAKFCDFQAITTLCGPGDEVIVFSPYWLSYPEMIKAAGAKMVIVPTKMENKFEPCPEDLKKAITTQTKLIIINSPNNPTGTVYSLKTLKAIADLAVKNNIMVLSDEIYEQLVFDKNTKHISIASLNEEIAKLTITVNGFSKSYAMTGWRLGYLSAPGWLVQRINALQSHTTSNATSFVQYAALTALSGKADKDTAQMFSELVERRELICRLLQDIPLIEFYKPQGTFYVLCDISKTHKTADEFAKELLSQKLLAVIPCSSFGAEKCIRLSYACNKETIIEAVKRLKDFCQGL